MPNNENRRNDDMEEFGEEMAPHQSTERTKIHPWTAGMIGECDFCGLIAGVPDPCRREDETAGCPRCGGNFTFYTDYQGMEVPMIDLVRDWRPGQTGRCNCCGFIARVFNDVKKEDGTAGCEMCGDGTFEFVYGLPNPAMRAPAPKPVYRHEIEGMEINLPRRVDLEILRRILELLRRGTSSDEILAVQDETLQMLFEADRITKLTVEVIKRTENRRRWEVNEPLLYSSEDKERLSKIKMLRVPLNGRIKIQFPGMNGPIVRWISSEIFEALRADRFKLIFDGKFKAVTAERLNEDERIMISQRFFSKLNHLLERGIVKAWSSTNEEIELDPGSWGRYSLEDSNDN